MLDIFRFFSILFFILFLLILSCVQGHICILRAIMHIFALYLSYSRSYLHRFTLDVDFVLFSFFHSIFFMLLSFYSILFYSLLIHLQLCSCTYSYSTRQNTHLRFVTLFLTNVCSLCVVLFFHFHSICLQFYLSSVA